MMWLLPLSEAGFLRLSTVDTVDQIRWSIWLRGRPEHEGWLAVSLVSTH